MTAQTEKSSSAANRARGRVLVIADEEHIQFVEELHARGIEVVGVTNGTAALISLQRARPHLVVANPAAKGIKVRELAKMVAQVDDGIPLILAGDDFASFEVRRAAMIEGAFDYFQLPGELELLIEQIKFLRLRGNDVLNRGDLGGKRCFLDRGGNDVRGQGEIGRFKLEAGILIERARSFDRTAHLSEYVRHVRHVDRGIEEIE